MFRVTRTPNPKPRLNKRIHPQQSDLPIDLLAVARVLVPSCRRACDISMQFKGLVPIGCLVFRVSENSVFLWYGNTGDQETSERGGSRGYNSTSGASGLGFGVRLG